VQTASDLVPDAAQNRCAFKVHESPVSFNAIEMQSNSLESAWKGVSEGLVNLTPNPILYDYK
jgi:hypothetical protein